MSMTRTDLALESVQAAAKAAREDAVPGVRSQENRREGYAITHIRIDSDVGAQALGKPVGRYVTVDLGPYFRREEDYFDRGVRCLAQELRGMLVDNLLVTRHMIRAMPRQFADFRPVAAVCPGVLARTGMEALELVRGAVERVHPAAVIAVDALAARDSAHLCATVQLSDTGLVPGSGVGNRRSALDQGTLGVPVLAVGIPTVVDVDPEAGLFLTPRDIDQRIRELGRLLGYGITLALQPSLTAADVTALLG